MNKGIVLVVAAVASLLVRFPAQADGPSASESQLPNLVPWAPIYVEIGPPNEEEFDFLLDPHPSGAPVLKFSTIIANRGAYPLDLLVDPTTDPFRAEAQQCIGWSKRICTERRTAGDFIWHPEHNHWHFEDFTLYELRKLDRKGRPVITKKGLISSSGKVSFCLMDSLRDDGRSPLETPSFYILCTGVNQGISPGWADAYESHLPGQELSISGVPDGQYALMFTADPDGRLDESDQSDNRVYATVELYEGGTKARLVP